MTKATDHARHTRRARHLETARRAYRERFGTEAPVATYMSHHRLADLLMEAVEGGEPLTAESLARGWASPRTDPWTGP
jgi:hypothetical protein